MGYLVIRKTEHDQSSSRVSWCWPVLAVYLVAVLIRFLSACLTSEYPIANIDEFLYYGTARSIAVGQGFVFRGQPTNFSYMLYSLVLSPAYLIGVSGPVLYRLLQLWNIMLVSLSCFPVFHLANRLFRERRHAIGATVIAMLLPDFMLGQLMMSENLIIPLFFLIGDLIVSYLDRPRIRMIWLIGIIGGLMFFTKPGAVIPAAVFFAMLLFTAACHRSKVQMLHSLLGIASTAVMSACCMGLVAILGGTASVVSIYSSQIANFEHLDVFFRFIGVYVLYIALAGGIGCFAVMIAGWKDSDPVMKFFSMYIVISLMVMILGVSWTVNRYEYNANVAHMRYIGMYLPMVGICAWVSRKRAKPYNCRSAYIFLGVTAALLLIGVYAGVNRYAVFVENMTLSSFISAFRLNVSGWVIVVLAIALIGFFSWIIRRSPKTASIAAIYSLTVCMAINNAAAYSLERQDLKNGCADQAAALSDLIEDGTDVLYIYDNLSNTANYGAFDVYSRKDISYAHSSDLFRTLYSEGGIYKPFYPSSMRGNIIRNLTPDTDTLVLDEATASMMQFSPTNTTHISTDSGLLHMVRILDSTRPLVDAFIVNSENHVLKDGVEGFLVVCGEEYLQAPCNISIRIRCDHAASLIVSSGTDTKTIDLSEGEHDYTLTFATPKSAYSIRADGADIFLYSFEIYK